MVRSVPCPDEALGISPALLVKKTKLYTSDWLECVARPEFLASFKEPPNAPPLSSNPNWIDELRLSLSEGQHFTPYQAPVPQTPYQQFRD